MKDVPQLEEHLNKMSNTLKVVGVILTITAICVLATSYGSSDPSTELMALVFSYVGTVGLCAVFFSEITWRLILLFGVSETRMLYFYTPRE